MSVVTSSTSIGFSDVDSRATDARQTGAPADEGDEPVAVDEFVARVLGRAHHAARAHRAPDEARVILELAQRFADELAQSNVQFDRLRFIEAAVEEAA